MYKAIYNTIKLGKCKTCNKKANCIIRGIKVCKQCFYLLKTDNLKRDNIKDNKIMRECIRCGKNELIKISYNQNILKSHICSECN